MKRLLEKCKLKPQWDNTAYIHIGGWKVLKIPNII